MKSLTLLTTQCHLNPTIQEVVEKEVVNLLEIGVIYPISHSEWVSLVLVVLKKGGMTVINNERDELICTRTLTRRSMCIDNQKLNQARKILYALLLLLLGCILDCFQVPMHPSDPDMTTFTCPYGTFSFGSYNTAVTFQWCMTIIFSNFFENIMEVFMDDFFVYGRTC